MSGGIWTITANPGTTGTFITTSLAMNVIIECGVTMNNNNKDKEYILINIEKRNVMGPWTLIPRSEFTISCPKKEIFPSSSSFSCMTALVAGDMIRCTVKTTDTNLDLNSGSEGNTYMSIIQLG